MATVNNATGVFATLGYNFSDPNGYVSTLSSNSQEHLSTVPPLITSWQAQDVANNDVGGYYQNPVASDVSIIRNAANTITTLYYTITNNTVFDTVLSSANNLSNTSGSFISHTNRLSNITPMNGEDTVNPYYESAQSYGKTALYITNQTDSISNNAPIMGSFTSILVGPQIKSRANTANSYVSLIKNSMPTGGGTSNLSNAQITSIETGLAEINTFLSTRQSSDVTFYGNLVSFVNKYNTVKQFNNMGETQSYLLNNFIGSTKLISRINS